MPKKKPELTNKKHNPFREPSVAVEEVDDERVAQAEDLHTERTVRSVMRPFTTEERKEFEDELVGATLRVRSLRAQKKEAIRDFNTRIDDHQADAIAAAEALHRGGTQREVSVECTWDRVHDLYSEVTEDTRELVLERPFTLEEIQQFAQLELPGFDAAGSWLPLAARAAAQSEESGDEDEDDEDLEEDEEAGE